MKKLLLCCLVCLQALVAYSQVRKNLDFGITETGELDTLTNLTYAISFARGGIYQFSIEQKGIGIYYALKDPSEQLLIECDTPEDIDGIERFEYRASKPGTYLLTFKRFAHPENTASGKYNLKVKSLSKAEIAQRNKIRRELGPENHKTVQTLDIDHFWEAFDMLKYCKSYADSVRSFQQLYLDRATDGLLDFIRVRDINAEKLTSLVAKHPKFYASIRTNTYKIKGLDTMIDSIFFRFKKIYPNFKPFKVCFAIGVLNTGGTVSNNFVLVGAEIATSSADIDLSEFGAGAFRDNLAFKGNIVRKIENLIAHECVHTRQKTADQNTVKCPLLYYSLREGICDFIREMVSGKALTNNHTYGDAHELQIWQDFKKQICSEDTGGWLYNYSTVKNRPADLGYYVGYKIAAAYYNNSEDKQRAVVDIIEMTDPLGFLEKSGYGQKRTVKC